MKKILVLLVLISLPVVINAQDRGGFLSFYIGGWDLQLISTQKFYPVYLADPLAVRLDLTSKGFRSSNIDNQDAISSGGGYLGKLSIKPASRISLFRFSPGNNPRLGIEIDMGLALPITMRRGNHDLIAYEGIYYIGISGAPTEWLSLRFAKHHICTHRGVEFWAGSVDSPIDFDPHMFNFYVRDDVVLSAAMKPLYFTGRPELNILQVYADLNAYIPGSGAIGIRQNKPNTEAYFIFQGGAEIEYYYKSGFLGGLFAAINISAWQENNYSPNYSAIAGYIFPQARNKTRFRIGIQYYNGRCTNNEFFNYHEEFLAFHLAADL